MKTPSRLAMARAGLWSALLLGLVLASGCAAPVPRPVQEGELARHFPFLREGRTSRSEVRARFGPPRREYEAGQVLIYRIWFDQGKNLQLQPDYAASGWSGPPGMDHPGQLVLTFSSEGVLEHAALLYRIPLERPGEKKP